MQWLLTLALLNPQPQLVSGNSVVLPGMLLPIPVPWSALPETLRQAWLPGLKNVPLAWLIDQACALGQEDQALALLDQPGLRRDAVLEEALAPWIAKRSQGLQPLGDGRRLMISQALRSVDARSWLLAEEAVAAAFAGCGPRPWFGPLLLNTETEECIALAPRLRLGGSDRDRFISALCALYLQRLQRGNTAWPAWLRLGSAKVLVERVNGRGPRARAMAALRAQRGPAGLRYLFQDQNPDPDLAMAVCALLFYTPNLPRLGLFLDRLRAGEDPERVLLDASGGSLYNGR